MLAASWSPAAAADLRAGTVADIDEPGLSSVNIDEPGLVLERRVDVGRAPARHWRIDLGFGLSSLLIDPDLQQGMGGGLYVTYLLGPRLGVEAAGFFSHNRFGGALGGIGSELLETLMVGNLSLGVVAQLTRPDAPLSISAEMGLGSYVIVPAVQEASWSLGLWGGLTLRWRVQRWLEVGFKLRYHVFNLTGLGGPELRDRTSFQEVGAIDRFEVPAFVAVAF